MRGDLVFGRKTRPPRPVISPVDSGFGLVWFSVGFELGVVGVVLWLGRFGEI